MAVNWQRFRFSTATQYEFIENYLSFRAVDKVTLPDRAVLEGLIEIYSARSGESAIQVVVATDLLAALAAGEPLVSAMERWFDPVLVQVFGTTHNTSSARSEFDKLVRELKAQSKIKSAMITTLAMPLIMLVMATGASIFIGTITPTFIELMPKDQQAELMNGGVTLASRLLREYGIFVIAAIFAAVGAFAWSAPRWVSRHRQWLEDLSPLFVIGIPFAIYRSIIAMRFFAIMSLMVSSGAPLRHALETIRRYSDGYLAEHIDEMLERTKQGGVGLDLLDTGLLPERLAIRMQIAGRTSSSGTGGALAALSSGATEDYEAQIKKTAESLKWVLLGGSMAIFMGSFGSAILLAFEMAMEV